MLIEDRRHGLRVIPALVITKHSPNNLVVYWHELIMVILVEASQMVVRHQAQLPFFLISSTLREELDNYIHIVLLILDLSSAMG